MLAVGPRRTDEGVYSLREERVGRMNHECYFIEWSTVEVDDQFVAVGTCRDCGVVVETMAWVRRGVNAPS